MATSKATFASGKETTDNENNMNREETLNRPSRKKDNFLRKKACVDQFLRVENTLNGLFEDVLNKKNQLHEDVDNLQQTLKKYMDSSDNTDVEDALRNEIKSQEERLQKAEKENSELQRKVEYQADAFGKSQSEMMQIKMENSDLKKKLEKLTSEFKKSESKFEQAETENSDLKKKLEKLTSEFKKSESKFEQAETENSDLKKKLEKLTSEFKKSESKFEQAETENSDLKKELNQFKISEGHFTTLLQKRLEENSSLQVELAKCKSLVSELEQKLEQSKKENDQMSLRLKESDERLDSWEKVGAQKNAQTGATQQNRKNTSEAERNEDEDCANLHQDIIDLMDDWFQTSYSDIFAMAIQNRYMEKSTVEDILFYTLWQIYTNSRDVVKLQLIKLRKGFYYPYPNESIFPDPTVPKDVNNALKKLLAKVDLKNAQRHFMEELMKSINKKHPEFPINHLKFISYLNASSNLCRQLVLKSECLHLKTLPSDANINSESFLITGKKDDTVKRVVTPALICLKNNVISTLRKGTVSTT